MKSELEQHYLATTYSVYINENKYDIKIGHAIPAEVNQLLANANNESAQILTAWNPRSELLSLQENNRRNAKLKTYLDNNNYTIFEAMGEGESSTESTWPGEEGFCISGITKVDAENLAVNCEQYAYVWLERGKLASLEFSRLW